MSREYEFEFSDCFDWGLHGSPGGQFSFRRMGATLKALQFRMPGG